MSDNISDVFKGIGKAFVNLFKDVIPTKLTTEQLALVAKDKEAFKGRCWKIVKDHDDREDRYQNNNDGKCPNCGALKGDIVNKIRQVHGDGSGRVSGNLFGVYGSSSVHVDTDGVNHCNKCGNEWKKYVKDSKYTSDVIKEGLNYTANLIIDPQKYNWAKDLARVFDGCYIETIIEVFNETSSSDLYTDTTETIHYSNLRPYFKSVTDNPENKEKLQKLY